MKSVWGPHKENTNASFEPRGYKTFFMLFKLKLMTVDPQKRSTWRSGVRSAMHAASQLPGKGPTDVDDALTPAR